MVPWATLALVALNAALFCHPLRPPEGACLSVRAVWEQGQWDRLLLAPVHHLSSCHLLVNMATLLWLGHRTELEVGSPKAGAVLVGLALLGGLLHLALNAALAEVTGERRYRDHCAVGFSGVLFSLEAMGRQVEPIPVAAMASGFTLTTRWLCLLECLLLAILYPSTAKRLLLFNPFHFLTVLWRATNMAEGLEAKKSYKSSLTGHLSGILAGLAFSAATFLLDTA